MWNYSLLTLVAYHNLNPFAIHILMVFEGCFCAFYLNRVEKSVDFVENAALTQNGLYKSACFFYDTGIMPALRSFCGGICRRNGGSSV